MIRNILLPAAFLAPLLLLAGDSTRERATMKGAPGVAVIIDAIPPDLQKEGVSEESLRMRLAQRLREADIPLSDTAKEFVGVSLTSLRDARGPYAVAVRLGFYQPVTLVRDPAMRVAPETWAVESVLMAAPKMVSRGATDSIDDLAARFISAWRAVNAK